MLILNCTKSFAAFIEPKAGREISLIGEPPSPQPSQDGPFLLDANGQPPRHVQQWLVNLVYIYDGPCIVAMDIATRYVMVFTGIAEGDTTQFMNDFVQRLVTEMVVAAHSVGMIADYDDMLTKYLDRHRDVLMFSRTDRSTQVHLTSAISSLEFDCERYGNLPESLEECVAVDIAINDHLRKIKGKKDYIVPSEEMLCAWMHAFGGLTDEGEASLRQRCREQYRKRMDEMLGDVAPD